MSNTVLPFEAVQTLDRTLPYTIALSGGVDSVALLVAFAKLRLDVVAHHVKHGNDSIRDQFAAHCQSLCEQLSIPLEISEVSVPDGSDWESRAREARYRALAQNSNRVLVLGHHLDDQVETVFLKLLRGSGIRGLRGMLKHSFNPFNQTQATVRPFLEVPKQTLEQFVAEQGFEWAEDPSNQCTDFDRNFLRKDILPLLETRWTNYRQSIAASTRALQSDSRMMEQLIPASKSIKLSDAREMSPEQFSYWIVSSFGTFGSGTPPSYKQVAEFVRQVQTPNARNNAHYELVAGKTRLVRVRSQLILEDVEDE